MELRGQERSQMEFVNEKTGRHRRPAVDGYLRTCEGLISFHNG